MDLIIPECLIGTPNTTFSDYTSDGWVGISAYAGPDDGSTWGLLQTGKSTPSINTLPTSASTLTVRQP